MHLLVIAAIAAVLLALAKKKTQKLSVEAVESDDIIRSLKQQIAMHVDTHKGLDLRVTVYLLGYVGILTIEATLFKDNFGMLPFWFVLAVACTTALGGMATAIALFAYKWMNKPRTPEEVLRDEKQTAGRERIAAGRLAQCERTSQRKLRWSNVSLVFLIGEVIMFAFGMAFL